MRKAWKEPSHSFADRRDSGIQRPIQPEADYGWKPGAIINIGIKSGTNSFHGTAYYFNRNSALDARNWFNPGPDPVAALNFHQFGASAGGPIVKNKLFIFGNYEAVRDVVGNPGLVDVPVTTSVGDPDISIADAFAQCASDANCSSVSNNLRQYLPFNPGPDIGLNMDLNNRNREDNGILKLDYHLSEKSNLVATYFLGDSVQTEEDTTVVNALFLSNRRPGPKSSAGAGSGRPPRGLPTSSGWATTGSGNKWYRPITIATRQPPTA